MAEAKAPKAAAVTQKNPRVTAKICEHMSYAGREAFKRLRTNVMLALDEQEKKCQVIGVTSAQPSEGKSTTSINLAFSIAELGKSVLLIDGDMRRPSIHSTIGLPFSMGLSDVLKGDAVLKDVITPYKNSAGNTTFDIMISGDYPDNPSELLNSNRFGKLIEVLSTVYECIILDLPPVNAVVDAVNASKCTDGLIVVVRADHCPRGVLVSCVDQLKFAKANVLGVVMNGCVESAGKRYQYSQPYAYTRK